MEFPAAGINELNKYTVKVSIISRTRRTSKTTFCHHYVALHTAPACFACTNSVNYIHNKQQLPVYCRTSEMLESALIQPSWGRLSSPFTGFLGCYHQQKFFKSKFSLNVWCILVGKSIPANITESSNTFFISTRHSSKRAKRTFSEAVVQCRHCTCTSETTTITTTKSHNWQHMTSLTELRLDSIEKRKIQKADNKRSVLHTDHIRTVHKHRMSITACLDQRLIAIRSFVTASS